MGALKWDSLQFAHNRLQLCTFSGFSHLFLRILRILFSFFFALSTPPFPRQFSSPKSLFVWTSDLLFLVEKRQPGGVGFWGRFWTRSPHRKKRKILFFLVRKQEKVSFGPLSKGNFRRKMTTIVGNRGQLWTSTLSPLC